MEEELLEEELLEEEELDEDEELLEEEVDGAAGPCITETVLASELATYTSPVVGFRSIAAGMLPTVRLAICALSEPSTRTLLLPEPATNTAPVAGFAATASGAVPTVTLATCL